VACWIWPYTPCSRCDGSGKCRRRRVAASATAANVRAQGDDSVSGAGHGTRSSAYVAGRGNARIAVGDEWSRFGERRSAPWDSFKRAWRSTISRSRSTPTASLREDAGDNHIRVPHTGNLDLGLTATASRLLGPPLRRVPCVRVGLAHPTPCRSGSSSGANRGQAGRATTSSVGTAHRRSLESLNVPGSAPRVQQIRRQGLRRICRHRYGPRA
jgi:hypothetical protein